jgi:hypothetical protein
MNTLRRLINKLSAQAIKPRRPRSRYEPEVEHMEDRMVPSTLGTGSIAFNFNGTAIPAGDTVWFSSAFKINGMGSSGASFQFTNDTISYVVSGTTYTVNAPNANVTLSPSVTQATTSFDAGSNTWNTMLPMKFSGNGFIDGVAVPLPSGLPGGIKNVTWQGTFSSDNPGLAINWQWSAAAYKQFGTDYNALNVKPVDDNHVSAYQNSNHAGTPQEFLPYVTGGATGGGGSNYTGSLSSTQTVVPTQSAVPATLSGFVTDTTGAAIAGVTLTLTSSTGDTMTAVTDVNGYYQFTGLGAGAYTVSVTPPDGYIADGSSAGTVNSSTDGSSASLTSIDAINLASGNNGINYNFQLTTCCQG